MATIRMMYFEGRTSADRYVVFTFEKPTDVPSEDFARTGYLLIYELEFDTSEGKGDGNHLPIEEELWPRW